MRTSVYRTLSFLGILALQPILPAAGETEWAYDDNLTLSVETKNARTKEGPGTHVEASARLPVALVNAWTDEAARVRLADGSVNPSFGESRGYRVSIRVTRDGAHVQPRRATWGTGPLADWLGVFAAELGSRVVLKRQALIRFSFVHPLDGPPANYEVTWTVNCVAARTERMTLPVDPGESQAAPAGPLVAHNGVGTYSGGTQPGAPYAFTVEQTDGGTAGEGSGSIMASLSPTRASQGLGLGSTPRRPVYIGWHADGGTGLAAFFSPEDADVARPVAQTVPTDLRPGGQAKAEAVPATYRLRQQLTNAVTGVIALAPGATVRRSASTVLSVEQGLLRISAGRGRVGLTAHACAMTVEGLAVLEVRKGGLTLWCVTEGARIRNERIGPGQAATWDGSRLTIGASEPAQLAEAFLRTCLGVAATESVATSTNDEGQGRTGLITRAVICRGLDSSQRPLQPGTAFPADVDQLTLLVEHKLPRGERAEVQATLQRAGKVVARYLASVEGRGKFVIAFHPAGGRAFRAGTWRLRLEVDGRLDRNMEFRVRQ